MSNVSSEKQSSERRWIADFDVVSHISVADEGKRLKFKHPHGDYEIHIKDIDTRPGLDNPTLSVQVIFKCDENEDIVNIAKNKLSNFLKMLSFATSSKVEIKRLKRIIDCTENLEQQKCFQYLRTPNPDIPVRALNEAVIDTIGKLMTIEHDECWWEGLKWYTHGIGSLYTDEQFQCFWLALEILAERAKETEPVPDKCQKCRTPLYCKTCNTVPTHRPFPKQSIEQVIDRRHKGSGHEKLFPMLNDFRNALFHGYGIKGCEKEHKIKFEMAMDVLGKLVFTELMSTATLPGGSYGLALLDSNTYCHKEVILKADMSIGTSKPTKADPEIEDFASVDVAIEIGERKADGTIISRNEIKS